jgi:hypothetical protein
VAARAFLAYQNGLVLMWLLNPAALPIEKDAEALADVFVLGIASDQSAQT